MALMPGTGFDNDVRWGPDTTLGSTAGDEWTVIGWFRGPTSLSDFLDYGQYAQYDTTTGFNGCNLEIYTSTTTRFRVGWASGNHAEYSRPGGRSFPWLLFWGFCRDAGLEEGGVQELGSSTQNTFDTGSNFFSTSTETNGEFYAIRDLNGNSAREEVHVAETAVFRRILSLAEIDWLAQGGRTIRSLGDPWLFCSFRAGPNVVTDEYGRGAPDNESLTGATTADHAPLVLPAPTQVIVPPSPAVTLEQEGYRWRDDDGSESAASWLDAQDTDISRAKNTNTRLRVTVDATGDPASEQMQLEYKESGDPAAEWRKVPLT